MYGGHITDDWDRRLCRTYLLEYLQPELVEGEMYLAPGFLVPPSGDYASYHQYVEDYLPAESPVLYGLHPNAEIGEIPGSIDPSRWGKVGSNREDRPPTYLPTYPLPTFASRLRTAHSGPSRTLSHFSLTRLRPRKRYESLTRYPVAQGSSRARRRICSRRSGRCSRGTSPTRQSACRKRTR